MNTKEILSKVDHTLLSQSATWEEIKAQAKVQFSSETKEAFVAARTGELGDYIFLKNRSLYNSVDVKLQGVAEKYQALDLETFEHCYYP